MLKCQRSSERYRLQDAASNVVKSLTIAQFTTNGTVVGKLLVSDPDAGLTTA